LRNYSFISHIWDKFRLKNNLNSKTINSICKDGIWY